MNELFTIADATSAIRALIEEAGLIPENGALKIELFGELEALLTLGQYKHPRGDTSGVQVTLVAGARNHLYRTSPKR